MMKVEIQPTQEQIEVWVERLVPNKDLFFLTDEDLGMLENEIVGALVIPKDEFFRHSTYSSIQWVNSYMYWTVSKKVEYVLVAQPDWIITLSLEKRRRLLQRQSQHGEGLLLSLSCFSEVSQLPEEYIVEAEEGEGVILRRDMWSKLPMRCKENAMKKYAQEYDEWIAIEVPAHLPKHLHCYANAFATEAGANCLAATLYASSQTPCQDEWVVHEWVHTKTFEESLKAMGYVLVEGTPLQEDVVVWVDDNGTIQHAAYCVGDNLFFNKNGQTFFNPWKLVDWKELQQEWKTFFPKRYTRL